jgi:hypothetical protein
MDREALEFFAHWAGGRAQAAVGAPHLHRKKSFSIFPSPAGMSLTKLSLGWYYDVKYKLFLPRESLVSDIPAGDVNIEKLFYSVATQPVQD